MREYGSLGSHGEIYLFHGADEKNIKSILDNDFSLNGTGVHATVYGKGIYFTNRLEYACKFTTDNPRKKFILIATLKLHADKSEDFLYFLFLLLNLHCLLLYFR